MPAALDLTYLRASIARLAEAREQLKAWADIEKEEKAIILAAIGEGIGLVSGVPAVAVADQVRRGLDLTQLRLDHPDLAVKYATETPYKVVRVL